MLSPAESLDELSRTISAALGAGADRSGQSVARASAFRWEEIARQYRRVFEEVAGKREGLPV
jgi:glycosyltransferase involved in cell wall biosynthesis